MTEDSVRIVQAEEVEQPRGQPPRLRWVVLAVVLVGFGVALLFIQSAEPDAPVSRTIDSLADREPSLEALDRFLPPPESTLGYMWSRVALMTGDSRLSMMVAGGPGLVAVGSSKGYAAVWTSVDGAEWSQVLDAGAGSEVEHDQWMNSVTVGGPGLVAVGSSNGSAAVWTSVDGLSWTQVRGDESVFASASLITVVAGGPGLVALGEDTDRDAVGVWTSVDGLTWARVQHAESIFGSATVSRVVAGGPGLVAVGHSNWDRDVEAVVWSSVDGIRWSRVPQDESVFRGAMFDVTASESGLVAVGGGDQGAVVWTSADGIAWSRVPHDETVFGKGDNVGETPAMVGVASRGQDLVAVGVSGYSINVHGHPVWISPDGVAWSRLIDEGLFDLSLSGIVAGGPGLVLFNDYGVWAAAPDNS